MFKISFKRWFETNFGKEKPELTWALVILNAFKFQINNFDENRYENIKCLARRIYSIRNALVHNKENSQNNYNPQYHYKMLLKEVPLIKAIASLIIIKSGHTF